MLGKIVALIVMRKTKPSGNPLFQRLLGGMAAVLILSLIAAMLLAVFILGAIYLGYETLIGQGMDGPSAAVVLGIIILMVVTGLVATAIACLRNIRTISKQMMAQEMPIAYRANSVANAFIDGLMADAGRSTSTSYTNGRVL